MKKEVILVLVLGFVLGVFTVALLQDFFSPIESYVYDKEDKSIIFTTDEIVTDYETLERRFVDKDSYGTTFKVYFEKE